VALLDTLERKFSWLAFPGIIRTIALLQAVFFVVLIFNKNAAGAVSPDWDKVLQGEVWRLFGFVFFPPVDPHSYHPVISGLFMFFIVNISFLFNDGLESFWGDFRTSLYVYSTIICQSLALHLNIPGFGIVYYTALFFAFATLFPHVEFRLLAIIPVKVWLLASFSGILLFLLALSTPTFFIFLGLSFLPYFVWAIPTLLRWRKTRSQVASRRQTFETAAKEGPTTLHRCVICDRTEVSNPELEFRVAESGDEYCLNTA